MNARKLPRRDMSLGGRGINALEALEGCSDRRDGKYALCLYLRLRVIVQVYFEACLPLCLRGYETT